MPYVPTSATQLPRLGPTAARLDAGAFFTIADFPVSPMEHHG